MSGSIADTAGAPAARRVPYSRRRAATLVAVYLLFVAHIVHWRLAGRTLAPLELNEVMYTLELGIVTAGFLFMALTFVGTLIFGRFFCSWACHILALEDLSAWVLRKLHIRPRPFRSRVLHLVPLGALLYMFVWPQVQRVLAGQPMPVLHIRTDAEGWASFATENFWRNLPPPGVALATFFVCGFAIVYLLGTRSFCRDACPYGALYALLDRFAPGRIRAREGCTACGTCTSVCQSDIRVHEELAAYGTVKSPQCLKDLDCIEACPSGAIGYGFGRPGAFLPAKEGARPPKRRYDLSLGEELLAVAVFLASLWTLRGLYGLVPFLLTLALGGILAALAVSARRVLGGRTVRLGPLSLRLMGPERTRTLFFLTAFGLLSLLFVHSAWIRWNERGGRAVHEALAGGAATSELELARGIERLERVERYGLARTPGVAAMLEDLRAASGDPAVAQPALRRRIARNPADAGARLRLAGLLARASDVREAERVLREGIAARTERTGGAQDPPDEALAGLRIALGELLAARGDAGGAERELRHAVRDAPESPEALRALARWSVQRGAIVEAADLYRRYLALVPGDFPAHYDRATLLLRAGRIDEALAEYERAEDLVPDDPDVHLQIGLILASRGRWSEAEARMRRSLALDPASAFAHYSLGRLLERTGRKTAGEDEVRRAAAHDPAFQDLVRSDAPDPWAFQTPPSDGSER